MKFEFDSDEFMKILEEKVKMPPDVRSAIVGEVGMEASNNIEAKIPIDTGITASFWIPSSVRTYEVSSWMNVSFHPKKFGNVGNKKHGWKQRTSSNTGYGWGWLSCFDPRNGISFQWLPKAIRSEKRKAEKNLKKKVENYYK